MPDANMDRWAHLDRGDALHVSVAVVILSVNEGQLQVLMTNNDKGPYEDHFVLPNRILRSHEMLDPAASEVFSDAAELSGSKIEQYFTYSCPDRDPRGRVVTTAYFGAAPPEQMQWVTEVNDKAMLDIELEAGTALLSLGGLGVRPGFSHDEVVVGAISRLRESLDYSLAPFAFLPELFTLHELLEVHQAILGEPIEAKWFRKKMLKRVFRGSLQIKPAGIKRQGEANRPAELHELRYVSKAERTKRVSTRAIF